MMKPCSLVCIILLVLVSSPPTRIEGQSSSHVIDTLDQLNRELKKATDSEDQILAIAPKVWRALDELLLSYLDRHPGQDPDQVTKELDAMLGWAETGDKYGWGAHVELYSTGIPDLYLADCVDFYWANNVISTFHVVAKSADHWEVVGRMEDSSLIRSFASSHRAETKATLARRYEIYKKSPPPKGPEPIQERIQRQVVAVHIEKNNLEILRYSVKPLESGGIQFVTRHTTRFAVTEPTVVDWEWTRDKGLRAMSWVWADEWTYSKDVKGNTAKWHSIDKKREGVTVREDDYLPR